MVWIFAGLLVGAALALRRHAGLAARRLFGRAATLFLFVAATLLTLLTLPAWILLPSLRSALKGRSGPLFPG